MRKITLYIFSVAILGIMFTPQKAFAENSVNPYNLNFLLGSRTLSDSNWDTLQLRNQGLFGVDFDFQPEGLPLSILLGISGAVSNSHVWTSTAQGDLTLTLSEFDLGIRKYFLASEVFHPYLSAGLGLVHARGEATCTAGCFGSSIGDKDYSGFFLNGGLMWHFSGGFNLGLDLKVYSSSEQDNVDISYGQAALLLGYGW
jgi:hypothetical protein